ncbi:MAG: peptidoglycan bridge formation glycyltransferase FemA/FemB family protein [Thermoflexales bacterium]|nr:peptidoglycan bridge formation glycyltransferase FemA/FemB family protein [Thermoflexales bacterium]
MHSSLVADREAWNAALASLPYSHVLQSWEWGQFKARHGWTPRYLLWQDGAGQPAAAALVLSRQLGPWPILYVPRGPALDYGHLPTLEGVLGELEELARRQHALFVKIDPGVEYAIRNIPIPEAQRSGTQYAPHTTQNKVIESNSITELLTHRHWLESREQIQFRNTMTIDLGQDEEALLAAMHSKTRYNVRLAGRKGVRVRQGGMEDMDVLYAMYSETAQRDGFIIRPAPYYRDAWGSFIAAGLGQPLIAEVDGQPVAGLVLFRFADCAYYFYGMSRDLHRDKMPNHLLQWEAIRWARAAGCATYDLWGAPDTLDESDPMHGVYRFKQGFGARFVSQLGAWDYSALRPLYGLYAAARPAVVAWMHKRHNRIVTRV